MDGNDIHRVLFLAMHARAVRRREVIYAAGGEYRIQHRGGKGIITLKHTDKTGDIVALTGCVAGAASVETIRALLRVSGFDDIRVEVKEESRAFISGWMPGSGVENYVASAVIEAVKPTAKACCGAGCCAAAAKE